MSSGSSPHTRGAPSNPLRSLRGSGIIPAYAGSTPGSPPASTGAADHPRIRGEHVLVHVPSATPIGSSPHTRGAPHAAAGDQVGDGIIPAYAGSTRARRPRRRDRADHPRIRGEHWPRDTKPYWWCRIIPAYAGSTAPRCLGSTMRRDHPRIRGEHSRMDRPVAYRLGSSPHTRGAPPLPGLRSRPCGIIPAYAGSTLEGVMEDGGLDGSSPHTRGAQHLPRRKRRRDRIIPAYAGSTRRHG